MGTSSATTGRGLSEVFFLAMLFGSSPVVCQDKSPNDFSLKGALLLSVVRALLKASAAKWELIR
jgi:hypothetical protein